MRWSLRKAWPLIWDVTRDVGSMGLGGFLAVHEALTPHPDAGVLVLTMALLVPSGRKYVKAVLSAPGESESSPSEPESGSPPSSPRAGVSGE